MSAREWRDLRITKATEGGTHVLINTKTTQQMALSFSTNNNEMLSNTLHQQ